MKFLRLFTPAFTSIGVILIGLAAALLTPSRLFAGQLDFPPTADFKILNADGTKVIGHTHFALSSDEPGFQLIYIESHYNNGEYEVERNLIESRSAHQMPVMADYYHGFFNPGGVLTREVKANFRTGKASCTELVDGLEQVYNETLDLPADTYAGSALIIPLQNHLSANPTEPVQFHDLSCAPGPKLFNVQATGTEMMRWDHYPGKTMEVEIKPAFGWIDVVIAPLIPKMRAWFNPADNWNFVGGEITRYYRGPEIIMARVPPSEASPAKPATHPEVASVPTQPPAGNSSPTLR
jgi:hypothetical protein